MRRGIVLIQVCVLLLLAPTPLPACFWDYDTLQMERQRFPYAQELIAGHFLRHSEAYYQWRVQDRSVKPSAERTLADYDDLAVAYEKLGEHDRAIEVIQDKMARWPDAGRYESEANLGTFLIHAGRYEEGLEHIQRAIEINPEAHFGREVYQKLLVKYVIRQREQGTTLPLKQSGNNGFTAFVLEQQQIPEADRQVEIRKAVKGVLGMMRFGNYRSPILLEALGDLLLSNGQQGDSKLLAARAYLKASYEAPETKAKEEYRTKAAEALQMQFGKKLSELETELQQDIKTAEEYYAGIEADEHRWSENGKNLDHEFNLKYYKNPALPYAPDPEVAQSGFNAKTGPPVAQLVQRAVLYVMLAGAVVLLIVLRISRNRRRRLVTDQGP